MTKQYAKDFTENLAPQRTAEWFSARSGKPSASRLSDFLSFSKTNGKPLKARTDYIAELAYEKKFNTIVDKFRTSAMDDGVFFEDLVAQLYEETTNNQIRECGAWVSDYFAASPDRVVDTGKDTGLLEIKVMRDNSYLQTLSNGVPAEYYLQIQGQLLATGLDWCDFIAMNLKTHSFKIIRVERDEEKIAEIYARLTEDYEIPEMTAEVQAFDPAKIEEYRQTKITKTDDKPVENDNDVEIWF